MVPDASFRVNTPSVCCMRLCIAKLNAARRRHEGLPKKMKKMLQIS